MLKILPAIIWGVLFFPITSAGAEQVGQADAVVKLLNMFASRTSPIHLANAGKLLNSGVSPAEALATDLDKPPLFLGGWNSPDTTRSLTKMLGTYVAKNPGQFPSGLPDAGAITAPLRLGPFFEGLFDLYSRPSNLLRKELDTLHPLLDNSWLEAASNCGSIHLQQLILIHRGQFRELLLSYQATENDIALICLGESVSYYSAALSKIDPGDFSNRTIALLLAGSLGMENPDPEELLALVETAAGWTNKNPELMEKLRDLRDPSSLSLLEAWRLWQKNEREKSLKQLLSNGGTGPWIKAEFVMRLFPIASLSDVEANNLIRLLPGEVLVACMKLSKISKPSDALERITGMIASQHRSRAEQQQTNK